MTGLDYATLCGFGMIVGVFVVCWLLGEGDE